MLSDTWANIILFPIIIGMYVLPFVYIWWRYAVRVQYGIITLNNGREYHYRVGNNMPTFGAGRFHGVEITLPKDFPHIYMDSLVGGGRHSRFSLDPSQVIHLEGDFSRYYRVYVPKRYEAIALSILSPDVMASLVDYAKEFDVEIYKDRLRIVSHRRSYKKPARQQQLLAAAIEVLAEIDHRIQSWTARNESQSFQQDLQVYPLSGFRIGRYNVPYMWLLWIVLMFPVWWALLYQAQELRAQGRHDEAIHSTLLGLGVTVGSIVLLMIVSARLTRFRTRRQLSTFDNAFLAETLGESSEHEHASRPAKK